tara:strand:- start:1306 stop:2607 length:1302 start_codon:yes stop_codon:yes gene_type:complete
MDDKSTKVAVVGAGNAGCLTALHYAWHSRKNSKIDIELIYNPDTEPERVGQATLTDPAALLYAAGGGKMSWYKNPIHATMKSGILYEGWGKKQDEIFHEFPLDTMAMHYCPWEMQKFVLKTDLFKVTEKDVTDIKDVDADYVFDCRGTPDDISPQNGYRELVNPTNAVILAKPNWNTVECTYSRHVATPDGWTFIIPTHPESPSHEYSVGYCYNSEITSKEDAEANFLKQFDVEITKHKKYKNYVATKPVDDEGRIFLNGNRLFFLEPLESTSTQAYLEWAKVVGDSIFLKSQEINRAADDVKGYIHQLERFVHFHYQSGSKYDTPFWDYAKELKLHSFDPVFGKIMLWAHKQSWYDVIQQEYGGLCGLPFYGIWSAFSFKRWIDGVGHIPKEPENLSKLWLPQGNRNVLDRDGKDGAPKVIHDNNPNCPWKA